MLNELRFVQGAVARKDFQPALTHFHIRDRKVQAYNGMLALGGTIPLDLDVTPNAVQLIKAIQGCGDATIALSMTAGGRLAVKAGKFKAYVDCSPGGFPEIVPTGTKVELPSPILPALRALHKCIAQDASRQWARGILFRGRSLLATNNVVLVEYFLGADFPLEMNLPGEAVSEVLRIGEEPEHLLVAENQVTFCYSGGRWLRSQLYTTHWPDTAKILDVESKQQAVPFGAEALSPLLPFLEKSERVYFQEGRIATSREEGAGAVLEIPGLPEGGMYHAEMLALALALADTFDFSSYPRPSLFFGKNLRGALIGMRP